MLSLDVRVALDPSAAAYRAMLAIAGGKPIALAEVGRVPSPALLLPVAGVTHTGIVLLQVWSCNGKADQRWTVPG